MMKYPWKYRKASPRGGRVWKTVPRIGQTVEAQYGGKLIAVTWDGKKFVDKKGKEVHNIVAWRRLPKK